MGTKRKIKKALSPNPQTSPPEPVNMADDDLMDELMSQLDSKDQTVQLESANVLSSMQINQAAEQTQATSPSKSDSRSRYKARQTRKAEALVQHQGAEDPEADARLQQEIKDEETDIKRVCDELGLEMHEINPDGHCLFSAIADQLALLGILSSSQATYPTVRAAAADYIARHPDDFIPFLPSAFGEDAPGAGDAGLMTPAQFQKYCSDIRDTGAWGGEPEILALAKVFNVPIHVVQSGVPPIVVHNPDGAPKVGDYSTDSKVVRISFHRRMYGLGEHYNSLRPRSTSSKISHTIDSILNR